MAFEGNIDGFMKMFGKSDGAGDFDQSSKGGYSKRSKNRDNHYYRTVENVDPETGEVLNYKPNKNLKNPYKNMAYTKKSGNMLSGFTMPQPKKIFDLAFMGAIVYGAYLLYIKVLKPLGNSPLDDAKDKAQSDIAKKYVDTTNSQVQVQQSTATSMSNVGLNVGDLHKNNANYLHSLMDVSWVNDDQIVKTVLGMSYDTFKLVNIAYGIRSLPTYSKSFTHILGFYISQDSLNGTLKTHLLAVLNSSSLSKISKYTSLI